MTDGPPEQPTPEHGLAVARQITEARERAVATMWDHEAIHLWFSLTYANYLVLPRSLLQSMPDEWQKRFVICLQEMHEAFGHVEQAPAYNVQVLKRGTDRVTPDEECDECGGTGYDKMDEECAYCHGLGTVEGEERFETPEEVGIIDDPIPHYNRGRTHINTADEEARLSVCSAAHRPGRYCEVCRLVPSW